MNTDAIDKLLEEIGTTEQRYSHEIIDKLVWARGEIERLNALVNEVLDGRDKAADAFAHHINDFDEQKEYFKQTRSDLEKERAANARLAEQTYADNAEIGRLKRLIASCTEWNWLDEDVFETIPEEITAAVDAIVKERLERTAEGVPSVKQWRE